MKRIRGQLLEESFASAWAAGRATKPEDATRLALAGLGRGPDSDFDESATGPLTRRERQVAQLVARGLTNRQVAEHLLVAPRTIETHLEHIFAKLGIQSRAELAAWAARQDALRDPAGQAI